jgi:tryptophanyl-tRNA synthetase
MTEQTPTSPAQQTRPRVLSGMRPTGRLHLGNYMGALYNWVQMQHQYECYFFVADYHALTTDYADTSELQNNIREVLLDFLAGGLDPKLCTIFIQSYVPAHFELNDLLGMITPVSWLERVPTYKDQQEQLKEKDLATFGFLGYPLLQSADILAYQPAYVPVGQDQAAHVEITREIARRFNHLYPGAFTLAEDAAPWEMEAVKTKARKLAGDAKKESFNPHELFQAAQQAKLKSTFSVTQILPEPQVMLTPSPKLPGTDGRKMSKSYKNTILLSDPEPEVRAKLKTMVTDPERVRRTDVGNPDVCPVFDLHKVFSTEETQQKAREGCTTAGIGCIECKGWVADAIVKELAPIQARRRHYEANPAEVDAILEAGNARANERANQTMTEVRAAMGLRAAVHGRAR